MRRILAVPLVLVLAGCPSPATGHADHVPLTPADLKWFRVPGIEKTEFAYLSGDPTQAGPYAIRVRLEAGAVLPPHFHPNDEAGTVLSGAFWTGDGNAFDKARGRRLPAGSYAFVPAGTRHFAWVEEPTEVQVHGMGPWRLVPVNPDGTAGEPVSLPARSAT